MFIKLFQTTRKQAHDVHSYAICYCSDAGLAPASTQLASGCMCHVQERDFNQVKDSGHRMPLANTFPLLRTSLKLSWDIGSTEPWGGEGRLG